MDKAKISEDDANKRKHERFAVETVVKYKLINRQLAKELAEAPRFREDARSRNISLSGVAIDTETALHKGDYLKVEMSLPSSSRPTRALAEVMWTKFNNGIHSAGIRFLIILNEADDNSIRRFVEAREE